MNAPYVKSMKRALDDFLRGVGRQYERYAGAPASSSKADEELKAFRKSESVVTTWGMAGFLIESTGDHISAFLKTVTEPIEVFASFTCVRASLESSALAAWLLDPRVDAATRVQRTFALRYEGLEQQAKFATAAKLNLPELQVVQERKDKIESDAKSLGYGPVTDKKGKRNGVGQVMPKITTLIGDVLHEETAYRLLSAIAHGHSWAMMQLGYAYTGKRYRDGAGVTTTGLEKTPNPMALAFLGHCAAKALARPLSYQFQYFGWDRVVLTALLERLFDELQADEGIRFWRTD